MCCWKCSSSLGCAVSKNKVMSVKKMSILLTVALGAAVVIWIHDSVNKGILNMSVSERNQLEQEHK